MKHWLVPICFLVIYTGAHFAGLYTSLITFGFMPIFFLAVCVVTQRLAWAKMAYLQAAFFVIVFLSNVPALDYTVYFRELQTILYSITLLFMLLALLALPGIRFDRILLVIACKFLIMSLLVLMNWETFLSQYQEGQRVSTGKDIAINSNQFGYFGFLGGAALLIYYNNIVARSSRLNKSMDLSKRWLKFLIMYVLLACSVCAFLGSRGGFLINSIFLCFLILQSGTLVQRAGFVLAIGPLLIAGVAILESSRLFLRMRVLIESGEDMRFHHFVEGMKRVIDNPFGYGAGHFPVFDSFGGVSHNTYLYVLHDYGVQGFIVFFLIMILLLFEYVKADRIFFDRTGRSGGFKLIYLLILMYFCLYDFIGNAYFWPIIFAFPKIYQYLQCGLDEKNRVY